MTARQRYTSCFKHLENVLWLSSTTEKVLTLYLLEFFYFIIRQLKLKHIVISIIKIDY